MKREDMKAAAKFTASCAVCGKGSGRSATAWTVNRWMEQHEAEHKGEQ